LTYDVFPYIYLYSCPSRIRGQSALPLPRRQLPPVSVTSNTYTSEGRSKPNARSRSTNFKPPAQRPVPSCSPPRTPLTVAPTQTQIQVAIAQTQVQAQIHAETQDSTGSQIYSAKPHGTDQLKLMGRKRTKKIPHLYILSRCSRCPWPYSCLLQKTHWPRPTPCPPVMRLQCASAHKRDAITNGSPPYLYHHQPALPTSTSELRYSYRYRPASPTSSALTKLPVTPYTPLFVQQRACQSPAINGVRARVII